MQKQDSERETQLGVNSQPKIMTIPKIKLLKLPKIMTIPVKTLQMFHVEMMQKETLP